MMSSNKTLNGLSNICAKCGKEGSGVTNTCNKCKSVMYCNAACKKRHRHKHKKACEEHLKRAAEHAAKEHDEKLFKQPPPLEDCPICMIRSPCLDTGTVYMACCGKVICNGCVYAFQSRAIKAGRQEEDDVCPFCRTPPPTSDDDMIKRYEKRVELNGPIAMRNLGGMYANGERALPRNMAKAFELWHRAAELGNYDSYFNIGIAYSRGIGVERSEKKAIHYWELGAIGGNVDARHNLGVVELDSGNMERALKHFMIAARDGNLRSLGNIKIMYTNGEATRDDYTKSLQYYQVYLDEIKSDQRDKAAAAKDSPYYEC